MISCEIQIILAIGLSLFAGYIWGMLNTKEKYKNETTNKT